MSQNLDDVALLKKLQRILVNCIGYEGDELAESRRKAYDYYFQRPRGDEVPGRSTIVSGDISSMVEGNLAAMSEPLTGKRIAEFCPYDAEDEEQAAVESDCIHDLLFKKNNGFIEVVTAIKDALLLRNAIVKVYIDERTHKQIVRRANVEPEIVTELLDQIGTVDVHKYDPQTKELSATVVKSSRRFKVEAIAPENFLYPKDWHRQDLEGIPACFERHVEPRSALIERGFDRAKVESIPRWNNPWREASEARLPRSITPHSLPVDSSAELVEWYEGYVRMDDGNGASELRCISFTAGAHPVLLADEPADLICYATGVVIINPHTFIGISMYDKLKQVQDASTALNRALLDNLNATNKSRTVSFDSIVEQSDLTDGRVNGNIRVKPGIVPDVRMAVAALSVPDTSANILANIEHMRRIRSEMGGASLDMATGQMQLNERLGSQGLDRAYSVMEQLAAFMTRVMAHTLIRSMYLIAHETLRTQWVGPIMFKRGEEWIETVPSNWRVRESIIINLGASQGERARMGAVLDNLMNKQAMLAQNGMEDILVDVTTFHNALADWLRINDVQSPERYLLNPKSERARLAFKKRAEDRAKQAAEQRALMQQAIALEQVRTALEKYKHDGDLQFRYYAEVLGAQIEEAKLAVSGVIDLLKAREQATALAAGESNVDRTGAQEAGAGTEEQQSSSERADSA